MTRLRYFLATALLVACGRGTISGPAPAVAPAPARWSAQQARAWYAAQPWLVGTNYVPRSAINQLEMWQAETFDSAQIDQELGWAEALGMNTMRVFLHDLLWQQDSTGFRRRIEIFLAIAARHHIRPMLVFFDSVWDPAPHLGPQHPPLPGIHNSGWVQSPGARALADTSQYPRFEIYLQGVLRAFSHDRRVLAWDLWNEPGAENRDTYGQEEIPDKVARVTALLPRVFQVARAVGPMQPLTSGVCCVESNPGKLSPLQQIQLRESDIITFHNYGGAESFRRQVKWLRRYQRPVICTEYMARSVGSTFEAVLPIGKEEGVGMINWGLVAGKTQTWLPWDSWQHPYVGREPEVWHHEVLRPDGSPYRQDEVDLIRRLTGADRAPPPGVN
ncbi:MAG TPA: cellulase family glycosylhydrolase [Gemmatimonadales bacterium]|nr:cellulase family glycosylhydrolase [Gemmatimonadales bacterium]